MSRYFKNAGGGISVVDIAVDCLILFSFVGTLCILLSFYENWRSAGIRQSMGSTKLRLQSLLEGPFGVRVDVVQVCLSIFSCVDYVLSTYPQYPTKHAELIEQLCCGYFFLYFMVHLYCANHRLWKLMSFMSLVEILTIAPPLVSLVVPGRTMEQDLNFLRFLRLTRTLRVLRMFKMQTMGSQLFQEAATVIFTIVSTIFIATSLYQLATMGVDSGTPWHHALYFMLVTVLGRPAVPVENDVALAVTVAIIFFSVFFIPPQVTRLAIVYNDRMSKEVASQRGVKKLKNHLVVMGHFTEMKLDRLLSNLFHEDHSYQKQHSIMLLHDTPEPQPFMSSLLARPRYSGQVHYVRGSVLKDGIRERLCLESALACLVLADPHAAAPRQKDLYTLTCVMSVKTHCPSLRMMVQVVREETKQAFSVMPNWKRNMDVVISTDDLRYSALAMTTFCPPITTILINLYTHLEVESDTPEFVPGYGVARMLGALKQAVEGPDAAAAAEDRGEEAATWRSEYMYGAGHELYRCEISDAFAGARFVDVVKCVYQELGVVLIGIIRAKDVSAEGEGAGRCTKKQTSYRRLQQLRADLMQGRLPQSGGPGAMYLADNLEERLQNIDIFIAPGSAFTLRPGDKGYCIAINELWASSVKMLPTKDAEFTASFQSREISAVRHGDLPSRRKIASFIRKSSTLSFKKVGDEDSEPPTPRPTEDGARHSRAPGGDLELAAVARTESGQLASAPPAEARSDDARQQGAGDSGPQPGARFERTGTMSALYARAANGDVPVQWGGGLGSSRFEESGLSPVLDTTAVLEELEGHVVVVGGKKRLYHLLASMHDVTSYIRSQDKSSNRYKTSRQKMVVMCDPDGNTDELQRLCRDMGDIVFVQGNAMDPGQLERARVRHARHAILLSQLHLVSKDPSFEVSESSRRTMIDTAALLIGERIKKLNPRITLVSELVNHESVYMADAHLARRPKAGKLTAQHLVTMPSMSAGHVFLNQLVDVLFTMGLYDPLAPALLEHLIMANTSGLLADNEVGVNTRPAVQFKVRSDFVGKKYLDLFMYLTTHGVVPLALYRAAGTNGAVRPYIYTCPLATCVLRHDDTLVVLESLQATRDEVRELEEFYDLEALHPRRSSRAAAPPGDDTARGPGGAAEGSAAAGPCAAGGGPPPGPAEEAAEEAALPIVEVHLQSHC